MCQVRASTPVAQLELERLVSAQEVVGSSPTGGVAEVRQCERPNGRPLRRRHPRGDVSKDKYVTQITPALWLGP